MSGKVLIVTRTKNRPLLLQRSIESVLGQTYSNWLHVIVNDGGDPITVEGITGPFSYRYQGRLKVIHNEKSVGMQNASNIAIKATESDYITIHDDDDTWMPLFLSECVHRLENTEDPLEQGVVTQSIWITEELDSWGNVIELSRQPYMPFEHVGLFQLAARNLFPPIAFLYRREVHGAIGYFDQTFNELGDHDFNLRFVARYNIGVLGAQLAGYHWRHQANGSSYGNTVTDGIASHRKTLVKMQNHYLRKDLEEQKIGMGFMMNMASGFESQAGHFHGVHEKVDNIHRILVKTTRKLDYYDRLLGSLFTPWKSASLPRRLYDSVVDGMGKNPVQKIGLPDAEMAEVRTRLQQANALSLDVFDTTLMRLVRKPTDVFLFIQEKARELLNQPTLDFPQVRIAAEHEAREEAMERHQSGETTLEEIYAVLQKRTGCDEGTAGKIMRLELEAEYKLCFPHPEITRLVGHAAGESKKVIFASDMYLPSKEIISLLERNGFKNPQLFLSSELRVSKHDGRLFDHVMAELKSAPSDILHIGDNVTSDVERARAKGLTAYHWLPPKAQLPLVDQLNSLSGIWNGDLASSLYTGLVRRRRLDHPVEGADSRAFWEMIGYEVIGPLYHAFVSWLIGRAQKRGLKKIFFLARDGYQLTRVFELFRKKNALAMEGKYLFASRRLLNFPRIERMDDEAMAFLIAPNPAMRAKDFLSRISFDPREHVALLHKNGFKNEERRITTKDGIYISLEVDHGMRRLMRDLEVPILEAAHEERKTLMAYLESTGLSDEGSGIVDIGWHGSSLRSLNLLLNSMQKPRKMPGFYFGTWIYAQAVMNTGCDFESFFMHLGQPVRRSHIIGESVEMVESFFSAPHPTIIGLNKVNGEWQPTYGEPEVDPVMQKELAIATESAMQFVQDALDVWPDAQEVEPAFGYLETTLERLLRNPRRDEAEALGRFSLRNTFGGTGPLRHVAIIPNAWERVTNKDALQYAYDHCYWKRGFYVQLSERAKKYVKP